jgi:hypothetical protein
MTPVFRIAYPRVFEPDMKKGDDGSEYKVWSCVALFPKSAADIPAHIPKVLRDELATAMAGEKFLPTLRAAANSVINAHWPDASTRPRKLHSPFRDADSGESCDDGVPPAEKWDGYAGKIFISMTSDRQPGAFNGALGKIVDAEEVYGGAWFRAQVCACTYASKKVGVRFILINLQKVADDDRFGGRSVDPNSFGIVPGATSATTMPPVLSGSDAADML